MDNGTRTIYKWPWYAKFGLKTWSENIFQNLSKENYQLEMDLFIVCKLISSWSRESYISVSEGPSTNYLRIFVECNLEDNIYIYISLHKCSLSTYTHR